MTDLDRWAGVRAVYGDELFEAIKKARVLVIGAGGIGCELLKNLVLTGFHDIEIADLDTIDVSNLNRQFLFQKQHVGQSKAKVARESALRFNPDAKIVAHHADVRSPEFGPTFISKFNIVLNALDNLPARRHVNRMCWAAGVPLVESGSAGWLGQVQPLIPKVTGCFECEPKPVPKKHAFCTIRNNPSKPIHCIIWAKMLFARLFGKTEDQQDAVTELDDPVNREVGENEKESEQSSAATSQHIDPELEALISKSKERGELEKQKGWERWLFHKIFNTDILQLASLKSLWKNSKPPTPLDIDEVLDGRCALATNTSTDTSESLLEDQKIWDLKHYATKFLEVAKALKQHADSTDLGLEWDKDEDLHLDFVTAASNIRSAQFGIPLQSRFTVKSEAGNIIPAIATTNAIVAGLIVGEAVKIIAGKLSECKQSFIMRQPTAKKKILLTTPPEQKNPHCYVCSSNFVQVHVDVDKVVLGTFIKEILCDGLNMQEPTIMVDQDIIYETGEDAENFAGQLTKPLSSVRIKHNTVLNVEDFAAANFTVDISIVHVPANEFEDPARPYKIVGGAEARAAGEMARKATAEETQPAEPKEDTTKNVQDEDDDVVILDTPPDTAPARRAKRKREDESELEGSAPKKAKTSEAGSSNTQMDIDVIELD